MERFSVGKSSMVASHPVDLPDVDSINPLYSPTRPSLLDVTAPVLMMFFIDPLPLSICYLLFVLLLLPKCAGLPLVSIVQIQHV